MESVPPEIYAVIASYLGYSTAGEFCRENSGQIIIKDVDSEGNTYKNGVSHSYGDEPAMTVDYGGGKIRKMWFKNGVLHRDGNKPAIVGDGENVWYTNGKFQYREYKE